MDHIEYNQKITFFLAQAEKQIKDDKQELEILKKNNSPFKFETLITLGSAIVGTIIWLLNNNFILFWIFCVFVLYYLILLNTFRTTKKLNNNKIIPGTNDLKMIEEKLQIIDKDTRMKTLYQLFWDMIIINCKPLCVAYSLFFLITVIFSVYLIYFQNLNSPLVFWGGLVLSLFFFICYASVPIFEDSFLKSIDSTLRSGSVIKNSLKKGLIPIVFIFFSGLVFLLICLITFGLPAFVLYELYIGYSDLFNQNIFSLAGTLLIQFLILIFLQGFLGKNMIIKWLERKDVRLKTNVITPVEGYLSKRSTLSEDEAKFFLSSIRSNYFQTKIYTYQKVDLFGGFFYRYFLIWNIGFIQDDEDFKIIDSHLKHQ